MFYSFCWDRSHWIKASFCLLCAGLLFSVAVSARASTNYITEQAWGEDITGQMSFTEAQSNLEMRPFDGMLSRGYGDSTIWVRLRFDATSPDLEAGDRLYLRIRPTFLDRVRLYDPLQPKQSLLLGDLEPAQHSSLRSLAFFFEVPLGIGPRELWLEIQTTSTRFGYFELLDAQAVYQENIQLEFYSIGLIGILSFFFIWGVIQLITHPGWLIASYVLAQVGAWVFSFWVLGLAYALLGEYLSPFWLDVVTSLSSAFYVLGIILFLYLLVSELRLPRWTELWFGVLVLPIPIGIALMLSGHTVLALQINPIMMLLASLSFTLMAHLGQDRSDAVLSRNLLITFNWTVFLSFVIYISSVLGFRESGIIAMYLPILFSLITSTMMLAILQVRSIRLRRAEQTLRTNIEIANSRAEQQSRYHVDKDRLLSMLAHELKTPVASMHMRLAAHNLPEKLDRDLKASLDIIRDLVERTVDANKVEEGQLRLEKSTFDLCLLLKEMICQTTSPERIKLTGAKDDIWIESDQRLLKIMLHNLIDNALKYSQQGTTVSLILQLLPDESKVELKVLNTPGKAGWPDSQQLFTKYYRSADAQHLSGTGLGLFLCRGLAELMDAQLAYAPNLAQVCFTITLPVAES